jgi:integrase
MPAVQRGQVDRVKAGHWRVRWYEHDGGRRSKQPFSSKSAAWGYFRAKVEPRLNGDVGPSPDLTLSAFVQLYLERHAATVRPRTIATLTERLRYAQTAFGTVTLRDLERMPDEIAGWHAKQSDGVRYARTSALRQTLEAAVRWGYMARNPAKLAGRNPQPAPRKIRAFSLAELLAISAELSPAYAPLPLFAAATGLRPEEWQALERTDVDRREGVLSVRRTVSSGEIVELAKTHRSRRQVPLSSRALTALDALPARLDVRLLFPAPSGTVLHLDNFRNRQWSPAIDASGVPRPARIYDLRSTFASNALAAGISVFELARIMGTSIEMIERHYGALLDGSGASIAARLGTLEAAQERLGRESVASDGILGS